MLYDPDRDRAVTSTKVIAKAQPGDCLKRDRAGGTQTSDTGRRLNCRWELNEVGALEMIWSVG